MNKSNKPIHCPVCGDWSRQPNSRRSDLCRHCGDAAVAVATRRWQPFDTRESRAEVVAAMRRLQVDDVAFRVIRDFAAFLEPAFAALLFLGADYRTLVPAKSRSSRAKS